MALPTVASPAASPAATSPTIAPTPADMRAESRAAWLAERRSGLGSSDAAAVLGLSPWKTPLHVYADKLGLSVDRDSSSKLIGRILEGAVADLYSHQTGRALALPSRPVYRHKDAPWLLCTPDRLFYVNGQLCPLEIKTSTSWDGWGPAGSREIPPHYLLQVQHQMMVLEATSCEVAVLIAGQDFRIYTIPALPELQSDLHERLTEFWETFVLAKLPPPPDWLHPHTAELVATLCRPTLAGQAVALDGEAVRWADQYQDALKRGNAAEADKAVARARLSLLMGEHALAHLPDGRRITRKEITVRAHSVQARTQISFRLTHPTRPAGQDPAGEDSTPHDPTPTTEDAFA